MTKSSSPFFISHMVQMKEKTKTKKISKISLYIPHGSDERWLTGRARADAIAFISHMVQMKVQSN